MDEAHEWTDREIKNLAERIRYHYRKAARELSAKTRKSLEQHESANKDMRRRLRDGSIDQDEYSSWLARQNTIFASNRQLIDDLTESANNATREARELIGDRMPDVYAENANYAAFTIDRAISRDTMFSLLDRDTVLDLMQKDPKLLPVPEPNYAKGNRWHSQKFTSAIAQGILQGESVDKIAKRVSLVAGMDYEASVRAARTAMTCAENRGRLSSYKRAASLGINGVKKWIATHDGRTRVSHRQLDGEEQAVDAQFSNGLMEPGDADGRPEEVYNCRCSMKMVVNGASADTLGKWSKLPPDVDYEDWKKGTYRTDRKGRETKASRNARGAS